MQVPNSLKKLRILFTQTHTEDLLSLLHRASVLMEIQKLQICYMDAMIWQKPGQILILGAEFSAALLEKRQTAAPSGGEEDA